MIGMKKYSGLSSALSAAYPSAQWSMRDEDYDQLEWYSTDIEKPTREELEAKLQELLDGEPLDCLRDVRNWMLQQTDWTQSQDIRAIRGAEWCTAWDEYRQALRDMTNNASPYFDDFNQIVGIEWPTRPPS
jgi:hypothetical protein